MWKTVSLLSLWDSHRCCTELHTRKKDKHVSFIHKNRGNVSNIHIETYPRMTWRRSATTQWITDRWVRRRLPLHLLCNQLWSDFSDTTKPATLEVDFLLKNRGGKSDNDAEKMLPYTVGWNTVSRHLPQLSAQLKLSHARAIKKSLFWFIIISGGL